MRLCAQCTHISQLVKSAEQLVEKSNQVLGGTLRGERGEPNNISKQDTEIQVIHITCMYDRIKKTCFVQNNLTGLSDIQWIISINII